MKGIVIAGTGSGVGKTSITTGIMSTLSKKMKIQPYKVGPDFIDPMYHTVATGRRCRNLDSFLMSKNKIEDLVGFTSEGADLCIVEGVRGLYEGINATTEECSTAEMAKILGFPVVLVINGRSLTRSAAAIINGFKSFDEEVNIAGVILNNISGVQHLTKITESIDRYCDVEILGVVKRDTDNALGQRHLGLDTINECGRGDIKPLESLVSEIDMDRLMDIAESSVKDDYDHTDPYTHHDCKAKVAIPLDDAYCFYYNENIECMKAAGMDVINFSPLAGDGLPDADIYYLGGGYPELYLKELSENKDFLCGLKNASDEKKIVFGECGGLMTMCDRIVTSDGSAKMSGIFDADAVMSGRHGPSYVVADPTVSNPLFSDSGIRGHEFHYSHIELNRKYDCGYDIIRGVGISEKQDGLVEGSSLGSYLHQHSLSVDDWLCKIVKMLYL